MVYDLASGDTHIVDALGMELLHLVQQRPGLSGEALTADLREVFANETDEQIAVRVERALERLRQIGLVVGHPR